jgi:hypothetical protein
MLSAKFSTKGHDFVHIQKKKRSLVVEYTYELNSQKGISRSKACRIHDPNPSPESGRTAQVLRLTLNPWIWMGIRSPSMLSYSRMQMPTASAPRSSPFSWLASYVYNRAPFGFPKTSLLFAVLWIWIRIRMNSHQTERWDPNQKDKLVTDPDPHQSDKPDPGSESASICR